MSVWLPKDIVTPVAVAVAALLIVIVLAEVSKERIVVLSGIPVPVIGIPTSNPVNAETFDSVVLVLVVFAVKVPTPAFLLYGIFRNPSQSTGKTNAYGFPTYAFAIVIT
jgi:hypothetical protein